MGRTMLAVVHNGNTRSGTCGRRTRQSPNRRRTARPCTAPPAWIGVSAVSLFPQLLFRYPPHVWHWNSNNSNTGRPSASLRSKPIVNKRMWTGRVVRPVCPLMPVDWLLSVFLTRFVVRCPFVRGIDMHNIVLSSFNFGNS